jgi:hypothetical protein
MTYDIGNPGPDVGQIKNIFHAPITKMKEN